MCRNFIHPITLHCFTLHCLFFFLPLHRGRKMIVLKAPIVAFVYFPASPLKSCRAPVLFRSIQRQQLMIKRLENCRPCHSKTNAGTLCIRCGFCPSVRLTRCLFFPFFPPPLALVCVRARGNKSLALVAAQGHTMQCDRYYQIVTKINLESLGLQLTGKVF